ncbi:MAG TPA: cell division protein SepF, partial [Actinomycetes bacterium]|nr:cell division protein SepF [Actinomycetes bacterium]
MAGAMRKMAVYLGLVENDDQYDEYDVVDRPEEYE